MEHFEQKSRMYQLNPIGEVRRDSHGMYLQIDKPYRPALEGLNGFSHAQILWWFDHCDDEESRKTTKFDPPFDAPVCILQYKNTQICKDNSPPTRWGKILTG